MNSIFDVIVLGLGGMGSAAAFHLAARGRRVLGLEQFTPAHDRGSSHGRTRMIRQAYFEDPSYVPLLWRTYDLWRELEQASGQKLLTVTGGLMMGHADSETVAGTLCSAREHHLEHEVLDAAQIRKRWPAFTPTDDIVGVHETQAGFVLPEAAVAAHLHQAERAGATLRFDERALEWHPTASGGVQVKTTRGVHEAGQLVITAGPWVGEMLADLKLPLQVERKTLFWFEPIRGIEPFALGSFPVWGWQTDEGVFLYGFPAIDGPNGGVKVAVHREPKVTLCTPDTIDRRVSPEETDLLRERLSPRLPMLNGPCLATATCMYTNAPDGHFVLGRHPGCQQVLIVSPCSGHGFKFCPVMGEVAADLVTTGATRHPIERFRLARLVSSCAISPTEKPP